MEVDAFLILVLSVYLAGVLGPWVLAIGAMRYAFVAAGRVLPWLRAALPPRFSRKVVAAVQGIALVGACAGVLPQAVNATAVALALSLLCWSFGRDIGWLAHRERRGSRICDLSLTAFGGFNGRTGSYRVIPDRRRAKGLAMLWKWKLGRDLDDVLHLLNGETRYDQPVPDARVCMAWRGDHPRFWVFAKKAERIRWPHDGVGGWGWKVATDADDVLSFLCGERTNTGPITQAQITATWVGDHYRFYVFYRSAVLGREQEAATGGWGWRLVPGAKDALSFLNGGLDGDSADPMPVPTARIAAVHRDHHDEFFVFYRHAVDAEPVEAWRWHAVGSPDDVRRVVERKAEPSVDFQVAAPPTGYGAFQLFTAPAARRAELSGAVRSDCPT
jgi:hypothetical protein